MNLRDPLDETVSLAPYNERAAGPSHYRDGEYAGPGIRALCGEMLLGEHAPHGWPVCDVCEWVADVRDLPEAVGSVFG